MNRRLPIIPMVFSVLFGIVLFFQLYVINQVNVTDKEEQVATEKIRNTKRQTAEIESEIVSTNVETINEKVIKDNVNIETELNEMTNDVKQTFNQVYNEKDFSLPKNYDSNFSEIIKKISEPTINQSGGTQRYFEKLEGELVAYGKYDISTNEIPTIVLVSYVSPEINKQVTGGKEKQEGSKVTVKGKDFYELTENLKTKQVELLFYKNVLDGSEG